MTFTTLAGVLTLLLALLTGPVAAQTTEITFYYPIAVGGPITKIVDGYAEQFMKENPTIKVKPVYAGTYQETIVKALTATRAESHRRPPSCSPPTCSR